MDDPRRHGGPTRAAVRAVGLALLGAVALAGCGDDGDDLPAGASTQTSFPTADPSVSGTAGAAREVPDPCAAATPEEVAALLGVDPVREEPAGAATYRGCTYTDVATDVVVLTITTVAAAADFETIWEATLGEIAAPTEDLTVAGADGARLVTDAGDDAVAMTGLASHHALVDIVNLSVPAPYDVATQRTAVTTVLEQLVALGG
ncbi:DUF3558 family protein [Nocardioides sp. ChNu-99]|uniref:DUF3558 family protein n=1 Tax=Nocardioides sp. ChNu-99 TaxID=2839897 RepID=UPI0024056D0E|nr:DUF3558 family protein [Nocardioides sp. ChNu-99]MDF9715158.1 DUF3558 family protein [Nocardioides sp. ChNu-99]